MTYRVPPLKPIRIPPSINDEDRNYLAAKRSNQNATYELNALFIEFLRKHQSKGKRIIKVSFNQAFNYVFPKVENEKINTQNLENEFQINSIGE